MIKEIPPNQLRVLNDHLKEKSPKVAGKILPNYDTDSETHSDKQVDTEVLS